ncbi:MAG: bifunctional ADP-dependent NAD(P)H-hydrate dehydratase/NAD(P)H-hydrate epimerase [Proteobacteria bacterium]|nr:MAG: bifunctional ADP-dependent NAD(P)H-hydrate dehydratase/NAD(P)H-hydrate epimerase [Pseudomonadota bacterium]
MNTKTPILIKQHPSALPVYLGTTVRQLDRIAIQEYGMSGYALMQAAGQSLFKVLTQTWPNAKSLCIVCGVGNNAGDGYIVARLAVQAGWQTTVMALASLADLSGDAAIACQEYLAVQGHIQTFTGHLPEADVLLDALLGTGLTRPVTGAYAAAIHAMNQHPAPILAADIPSGLHADTGQVCGDAVKAAATLSFIGLKTGLFTGQARRYRGAVWLDDLCVPAAVYQGQKIAMHTLSGQNITDKLPKRSPTAHKGQFGHCLFVGGAPGMSGAIRLAGEAALRTGAGLVSIATHPEHAPYLNIATPELMVHAVPSAAELRSLMANRTVLAIGPGLGQNSWAHHLLTLALATELPKVIDADALNSLACFPAKQDHWILTPHSGEAARLLACSVADIENDRIKAVQQLQQNYGGVIVLKGADTLIASAHGIACCIAGNPGMASGGMGDVLTGIITALLAQGLSLPDAACIGVQVHAQAGDKAAQKGERGLLASDLIQQIRAEVNP